MIDKFSFKNFKSWRDTGDISLSPITAFFGTNSSGKTSLLQMLLLLKQTTETADRNQVLFLGDKFSRIDLGSYQDAVFKHDVANDISFSIEWSLAKALEIPDPEDEKRNLFRDKRLKVNSTVGCRIDSPLALGRMITRKFSYEFASQEFGMSLASNEDLNYELFSKNAGFKFVRSVGRAWPLPPPIKCYGFPDQVRGYYQNAGFLSVLELQFQLLFKNVYYLGPLRDYPQRDYTPAGTTPEDMGPRGQQVIDAILSSNEKGPTISRGRSRPRQTLGQRVAEALKELGLIHSFEITPVDDGRKHFQVWVHLAEGSSRVLITDVGFGVSQILPVIALCYYVPEGSTILLEQPEIHLHPSVQSRLADLFVDAMKKRKVQIIIESHSEHLLRRFQRRIAEEKLTPKELCLYFCSERRGESRLSTLDIDMFGVIQNWPRDFFGDEFGEIAATTKAALKRRIASRR